MLTSFKIQNFRGYSDFELDTLKRITIIGGKNNTGKTALLEALAIFFQRINPNITLFINSARGMPILLDNPDNVWGSLFHNYKLDNRVSFGGLIDDKFEKMEIKLNRTFPITSMVNRNRGITQTPQVTAVALDTSYTVGNEKKQVSHLVLNPAGISLQIENAHIENRPCTFITSRAPVDPNELASRLGQIELEGKTEELVLLLKTIEPRLKALTTIVVGNTSCVYGDIGLDKKIPIALMGDGMNRLLQIALVIATSTGGLILVDEFENGIHHSVMPSMWNAISKMVTHYNCQLIATTHSYECLKSAHGGIDDQLRGDIVYIRLNRKNGAVTSNSFDYESLSSTFDYEMEIR